MYIGVDIGGTKCAVVKADGAGNILKKVKFDTADYQFTRNKIVQTVKSFGDALAIGISCGGPLDSKTGFIMSPPNLPDWDNVPIVDILQKETGIKAYLQNDANACALAEWKMGAGRGCNNMVFLTFGTGMGAGLILNGALYEGTNGNAGEVGHIRLRRAGPIGFYKAGSFEGFCSGGGIAQQAKTAAKSMLKKGITPSFCDSLQNLDQITAKSVAEYAQQGCQDAIKIYKNCGKMLGEGLAIIIDLLNPEKIVIGSVYERSGELMQTEMLKTLKKESLASSLSVCNVVAAKLGDKIGDCAAIAVAIYGESYDKSIM